MHGNCATWGTQNINFDTGLSASFDHTFDYASKGTVIDSEGRHKLVMKGGLFTVINEKNEIMLYVSPRIQSLRNVVTYLLLDPMIAFLSELRQR